MGAPRLADGQARRLTAPATGVLLSLVAVLIAGTLKVSLTATVGVFTLPLPWAEARQTTLFGPAVRRLG